MRVVVILNPISAGASRFKRDWNELHEVFIGAGWHPEVLETGGPGHARALAQEAAERAVDLVVVAGGDGTLNETVNGIACSATALGAIPIGTTNVWAREIGLPLDPLGAARKLTGGIIHEIDLGRANGRYFLLMAGIGFDGYVMGMVTPGTKRLLGIGAYLLAGAVTAATFRSTTAHLRLDGRRVTVDPMHLIVVGNTRQYALVQIATHARADDGLLDVCIFTGDGSFLRRASHFFNVITGRHTESTAVNYDRAREVRIETEEPMPVQLDGDVVGHTPMRFVAVPRALRVLLPSRAIPILQNDTERAGGDQRAQRAPASRSDALPILENNTEVRGVG